MHLTARRGPGFKVVRFAGYTIRVPASWPVYRLDRDPSRCVRYDQHAVYLGQPGANQQCPAHLVGRTATISIQAAASTPGPASGMGSPVGIGAAIGTLPQVGGSVTRDDQDQEMGTSLADPGVSVTGTYTGGGRGVLSILRSLRRGDRQLTRAAAGPARARVMTRSPAALLSAPLSAPPQSPVAVPRAAAPLRVLRATQSGHPRTHQVRKHKGSKRKTARQHHKRKASKRHTRQHRGRTAHSQRRGSHKHGVRKHGAATTGSDHRARHHGPGKHRAHPRTPRPRVARHGFDSCTTPSLAAMRAWRRAFSAMAVYIGGVEAGCASPNLTADWVRAVTGLGWALMPTS